MQLCLSFFQRGALLRKPQRPQKGKNRKPWMMEWRLLGRVLPFRSPLCVSSPPGAKNTSTPILASGEWFGRTSERSRDKGGMGTHGKGREIEEAVLGGEMQSSAWRSLGGFRGLLCGLIRGPWCKTAVQQEGKSGSAQEPEVHGQK